MKFHLTAAAALLALAPLAQAQVTPPPKADTRTTPAEMQRGVPGVDVDVNTRAPARNNGVPGVDVDVGNRARTNRVPGADVDTRTSGAAGTMRNDDQRMGADTQFGTDRRVGMRADRN